MKLEEVVPEMTEQNFQYEVNKIIEAQKKPGSIYYPLFRDRNWTFEELINELSLIQNKTSNLSRFKRDAVSTIIHAALLNMVKTEE